jgi:hypothetical protein
MAGGTLNNRSAGGSERNVRLRGLAGHWPKLAMAWRGLCLSLLLGTCLAARAQPIFSTEYEIKSVLLFNLAQFVEWPGAAFDTPSSPIVIGVVGENPFGNSLEKVIEGETVQNRKLIVRYFRRPSEIEGCHLLFISRSESARVDAIFSHLKGRPVLTVGDTESFGQRGGMVRFVSEKNKVRLRLNVPRIEESRLKVSSKLLRIAELAPR